MAPATHYRHAGIVLVRASTDPGDLDLPSDLNLAGPDGVASDARNWVAKVWARPEVRDAVSLASPVLGARLDQLLDENTTSRQAKDIRRAVVSMASYLLRWRRRATPFGVFAGVTTAAIGPARAEVGKNHQVTVRADAEWLATLIGQLDQHQGLRSRLTVVADNTRIVRDGRVIVHRRAQIGSRSPGPLTESSVRLTKPVRFALDMAGTPIRLDELAGRMMAHFSTAQDKVPSLLDGLVEAGLLITSLHTSTTTFDPLSHLIRAVQAAGGDDCADVARLLRDLINISGEMARHNDTTESEEARTIRSAIAVQMSALVPRSAVVLAADTRLDARIAIPEQVLDETALAANVLLRTTTQPFGSTSWLDYHARFRARHGIGALVPVRDLVADSGLGYPTGYLGAPRARPAWRALTARDAALLALIQRAALDDAEEVTLSENDVEALTVGEPADIVPPQRIELGVAVHAASIDAINRGDFQLQVTAAPRIPTSMAGRFAHLLSDPERALLAATYVAPPGEGPDACIAVQLSFPSRRPHNENVTRVPALLQHVVTLSEHPYTAHREISDISVDDLAVTADAEQMYLVQRSTGRRVIPRILHALDTVAQTPPLARFLAEVADARSATFRGFDLGAARTLPYMPRIRYHRTVLAPARWSLTAADLARRDANDPLCEWRQRWRVPAHVVLVQGELRLPLDLDQRLDRALLRTHLERAERIELHEDGPASGQGWIGRPAELLIPMTAVRPSARRLPATDSPGAILRPGDSAIVQAQIVGNPARFDDILTAHLPKFVAGLGILVTSWWTRRHRDMIRPECDQYLAVFLRLSSAEHHGPVAARTAALAAELEEHGLPCQLALVSTPQHTAHYGHGPALIAAERVFATDTAAAVAQIATARESGVPAQALAAASMTHLVAAFAPDPLTGYRGLVGCLRQERGPLARALRDHALTLADPTNDYRAVRALPGGDAVATAWCARGEALTDYHQALGQQRDPSTVLRTLLHEHHVRAVGVDPTFEKETGRLARVAALRRLALAGAR